MNDIETTKKCAEKMGLRLLPAYPPFHVLANGKDYCGLMVSDEGYLFIESGAYDPLHDDAQAMALVKAFGLGIDTLNQGRDWTVFVRMHEDDAVYSSDLNRAICECVAKL